MNGSATPLPFAARGVAFLLVVVPAFAPAATPDLTPREKGDLAIRARDILRKYCHECHAGTPKHGTVAVLDHPKLVATGPHPVPFVAPGDATGSQILHLIEDGSMPPGGKPRPGPDEVATLKKWVAAGAPHFPAAFDDDSTLRAMLDDVAHQPAADVPHLRYFSFAHLVRDNAPVPDLTAAELELQRGLLRAGVSAKPVPVDAAATLYRLDIRGTGWENRELFYRATKGAPADVYPLTAHDLLLLEYPHGFGVPADHPEAKRLVGYLAKAKPAWSVPFLRANWVSEALKENSPLADDLRSLADLSESLRKQGDPALDKGEKLPCGPKTRAFAGRNPVPPATRPESPSPLLPLSAWYVGDCRVEPPPFKLTAAVVDPGGTVLKAVTDKTPFRLKVTTDRDVRFVLLMVWADGTVALQPTQANGLLKAGETFLAPADSGAFQIAGVLTGESKGTEYFVFLASPTELPPVVIVRSRHASHQACRDEGRFPIYRFLFDPETKPPAGFDPSRVVRTVLPVTVKSTKGD